MEMFSLSSSKMFLKISLSLWQFRVASLPKVKKTWTHSKYAKSGIATHSILSGYLISTKLLFLFNQSFCDPFKKNNKQLSLRSYRSSTGQHLYSRSWWETQLEDFHGRNNLSLKSSLGLLFQWRQMLSYGQCLPSK